MNLWEAMGGRGRPWGPDWLREIRSDLRANQNDPNLGKCVDMPKTTNYDDFHYYMPEQHKAFDCIMPDQTAY